MRRLLIGLVLILFVVVGGLTLAVMNVNGLLEENHERLSRLAGDVVGRDVRYDKAEATISQGLSIRLDGLHLSEDPRFGQADFLALESAFVDVKIWPALQRRLEVSGVRLDRPTIHVIQTAAGFNFSSLGQSPAPADPKAATPMAGSESQNFVVAIAAFEISDGTILYEDRTADPPLNLTIENFDSSGVDLSLQGPLELAFSGRLHPTRGDATLASSIRGRVEILDLATGAGGIRLTSQTFFPLLLGLDFEEGPAVERLENFDLDVGLPADAATKGYPISLRASGGRLAGFDFLDLDAKLRYVGSRAEIKRLVIGLAGGKIELTGNISFGTPGHSPFHLDTKLSDLDVDQLGAMLISLPRGFISGRIGGDIDLSGKSLDWATLKESLTGQVRLEIGKGALENVNLLNHLTSSLVRDPGAGQLMANSLREVAPAAVQGTRTPFQNVDLNLKLQGGTLNVETFALEAGDFSLAGLGRVGLDGSLSANGKLEFSEAISKQIFAKADRLAPLFGKGTRIALPLQMRGTLGSPNLRPDLTALAAQARANATAEVTSEASRQLSTALFGKNKKKKEGDATAPPDQKELDRQAAEKLLNKGLGKLLGD